MRGPKDTRPSKERTRLSEVPGEESDGGADKRLTGDLRRYWDGGVSSDGSAVGDCGREVDDATPFLALMYSSTMSADTCHCDRRFPRRSRRCFNHVRGSALSSHVCVSAPKPACQRAVAARSTESPLAMDPYRILYRLPNCSLTMAVLRTVGGDASALILEIRSVTIKHGRMSITDIYVTDLQTTLLVSRRLPCSLAVFFLVPCVCLWKSTSAYPVSRLLTENLSSPGLLHRWRRAGRGVGVRTEWMG